MMTSEKLSTIENEINKCIIDNKIIYSFSMREDDFKVPAKNLRNACVHTSTDGENAFITLTFDLNTSNLCKVLLLITNKINYISYEVSFWDEIFINLIEYNILTSISLGQSLIPESLFNTVGLSSVRLQYGIVESFYVDNEITFMDDGFVILKINDSQKTLNKFRRWIGKFSSLNLKVKMLFPYGGIANHLEYLRVLLNSSLDTLEITDEREECNDPEDIKDLERFFENIEETVIVNKLITNMDSQCFKDFKIKEGISFINSSRFSIYIGRPNKYGIDFKNFIAYLENENIKNSKFLYFIRITTAQDLVEIINKMPHLESLAILLLGESFELPKEAILRLREIFVFANPDNISIPNNVEEGCLSLIYRSTYYISDYDSSGTTENLSILDNNIYMFDKLIHDGLGKRKDERNFNIEAFERIDRYLNYKFE